MGTLGSRISFLRKSANMSQEDLAFDIDISKGSVSNYENDRRTPDFKTLEEINKSVSRKLGDQLFFIVTGMNPKEYLTASRIESNYIEKRIVIKCFNDWVEKMILANEIKVKGNIGELANNFIAALDMNSNVTHEKQNGTTGK